MEDALSGAAVTRARAVTEHTAWLLQEQISEAASRAVYLLPLQLPLPFTAARGNEAGTGTWQLITLRLSMFLCLDLSDIR